jgi:uncharacterized protein YdeI (YjbR/CyaY-like superfamily)
VSALTDAPQLQLDDRPAWRTWLEQHHATARGVWLVMWRPRSGRVGLDYDAAVEEALCFGWVDSTGGTVDDERTRLYFAPRKRRSAWSGSNKIRVERLIRDGLMAPAGQAAIDQAKANGSWSVLESVERLEVPPELAAALAADPVAGANFAAFSPSVRKQYLAQIALAGRPETRASRVSNVVEAARENRRPG